MNSKKSIQSKKSILPTLIIIAFTALLIVVFSVGYFLPRTTANTTLDQYDTLVDSQYDATAPLPDFSKYKDISKKKIDFFEYLLPKVHITNQEILNERKWLTERKILSNSSHKMTEENLTILYKLVDKYKIKKKAPLNIIKALLIKVDIIPPSLVLAQAANESAWGTSRFAKQANNLFGQWCYVKGCGLIPKQRGKNERHEVAKFKTIQGSVSSYMRNLNSQHSYEDLRALRAKIRSRNKTIRGYELANGLLMYSTRRQAYVDEIQHMIQHNKLYKYDSN